MGIQYNEKEYKTHQQIQFLFDTTPLACQLWNKNFDILLSNDENTKLFQIKDKETFHNNFFDFTPEYQPDGQLSERKALVYLSKAITNGKCVLNWSFRTLDGLPIPTKVTLIRIFYENDDAIIAYVNDLREHNQLISEIAKRDNLLHAVNDVAATLLSYKEGLFEDVLQKGIERISHRVNVDRAYIWKNKIIDDKMYYVSLYEWVDEKKEHGLIVHSDMKYRYSNSPRWEEELGSNRCINGPVSSFPPNEKEMLIPYNVKSLLVIPVHLDSEFWGFISFDDCQNEREFSYDEVNILRSASLIIVNAIIKHELNLGMIESSEKLAEALQKAQDANNAKSSFLSTMSHEIRTPMNAIIGMTKIGKSTMEVEKMLYALDKIDGASKHLLGVINDILDISKIEANKLTLSLIEFKFEKMVESIINIIRFRAEEKHQRLYVYIDKNIPSELVGDDQRLSQAITNLLSNAVKFTPEGKPIHLNASLDHIEDDNCTLKISVKDSGIGISKDQQTKLFSTFQQAESGISRKYGGTGLGLAITKHIVELMDGKIWIESDIDKGATFTFLVKLRIDKEKTKGNQPPDIKFENVNLLFVSKDRELTDYFADLSERLGVRCDSAHDTEDALKYTGSNSYDLCFIDWDTDDVNSHHLRELISPFENINTKFVLVSWYNKTLVEQDFRSVGIDMSLAKPLFISNVIRCINKGLNKNFGKSKDDQNNEEVESFKGSRLLLTEDLDINREIVMAILEPTQIDVECAENGLEAVKMYEADNGYDVILMDIQMPVMNGYEATRKIRDLESNKEKKIPIIAMTANVFREDIEKCIESGMNGHLGKPLDTDKLINLLRVYLK